MKIKTKETLIKINEKDQLLKKYVEKGETFEVVLKTLALKEQIELSKTLNIVELDLESNDPEMLEKTYSILSETANKVIVSWSGISDENGEELEFSEDSINALVNFAPEFIGDILNEFNLKQEEADKSKKK